MQNLFKSRHYQFVNNHEITQSLEVNRSFELTGLVEEGGPNVYQFEPNVKLIKRLHFGVGETQKPRSLSPRSTFLTGTSAKENERTGSTPPPNYTSTRGLRSRRGLRRRRVVPGENSYTVGRLPKP